MLENKPFTDGIRSGSGSKLIAAAPHLLQCVGGGDPQAVAVNREHDRAATFATPKAPAASTWRHWHWLEVPLGHLLIQRYSTVGQKSDSEHDCKGFEVLHWRALIDLHDRSLTWLAPGPSGCSAVHFSQPCEASVRIHASCDDVATPRSGDALFPTIAASWRADELSNSQKPIARFIDSGC